MRKLLPFLFLIAIAFVGWFAGDSVAQGTGVPFPSVSANPNNQVCGQPRAAYYIGTLYTCQSGKMAKASGSSSGTVTSVAITGTANQIGVTGTCSSASAVNCQIGFTATPILPSGTTGTTQSQADGSTKIATTLYVDTGLAGKAATTASTTVNSQVCVLSGSCTIPFQVGGVSNTSQAGLNLITSTTNGSGLILTPTNSGTNQVKFEATGTVLNSKGGTGTDTSASTGVAQINAGTWSVSSALVNGTTATTQSQADGSTKIATTAYVDTGLAGKASSGASTTVNGQACALSGTCNVNIGSAAHSMALNQGNGSALTGLALGAHQVPVGTAASDPNAKTVPDCTDTGGNHLNFTQSTDAFSCGTSGGSALHSITFVITGASGGAIATGDLGLFPTADFACTINRTDISADQSGSITVDIWKRAGAIPTSAQKISASAPVTLSSAQLNQNGSISGWSTSVSSGDIFGATVATASTVTKVTVQIWCQ